MSSEKLSHAVEELKSPNFRSYIQTSLGNQNIYIFINKQPTTLLEIILRKLHEQCTEQCTTYMRAVVQLENYCSSTIYFLVSY